MILLHPLIFVFLFHIFYTYHHVVPSDNSIHFLADQVLSVSVFCLCLYLQFISFYIRIKLIQFNSISIQFTRYCRLSEKLVNEFKTRKVETITIAIAINE
jgi:hypothetical protein